MRNELIKLRIKEAASGGYLAHFIIQKFVESCVKLDASIFEPLIQEEQYFQNVNKYLFLHSLKKEFDRVKESGLTETTYIKGKCRGCYNGELNYEFYGDSNKPEFAYIIHKEQGGIKDIFICNFSSGHLKNL